MNTNRKKTGMSGINGVVLSMLIVISLLLTAMLTLCGAGCSTGNVVQSLGERISGDDDQFTYTTVATSELNTDDTADPMDEDPIPKDSEDVVFANYDSEYYIVVYTLNCSVVVLGKDEYGKYTKPVKTFLCSTGSFDNDTATNNGVYDIVERFQWRFMMDVYGRYATRIGWGTGYLFHSVPYREEGDIRSLTGNYDKLGTNASHGCIRLCLRDAKWIYDNIPNGTQVHIVDGKNGPAGEPVPMRIKDDGKYAGWDPTDPDPRNPYNELSPADFTYFTHTSAGTEATTVATSAPEQE